MLIKRVYHVNIQYCIHKHSYKEYCVFSLAVQILQPIISYQQPFKAYIGIYG